MIDLHSHILPEMDDGSQSLGASLAMARIAVESGVTAVAATPHCSNDRARETRESWELLSDALRENEIPLKLYPGMEIFGTRDTPRLLKEGKLLTLNESRYPLIEFSFLSDGEEETKILRAVCREGYRPVVAHPERYSYVQRDPRLVNIWYNMGCLIQVNRGSLTGRFGRRAKVMAWELVERGFATVVASDAHSPEIRTPWLKDVREMLAREVAPLCARMLLRENPGRILRNEEISLPEPDWFEGSL